MYNCANFCLTHTKKSKKKSIYQEKQEKKNQLSKPRQKAFVLNKINWDTHTKQDNNGNAGKIPEKKQKIKTKPKKKQPKLNSNN